MSVAKRIREIREVRGFTQAEMARSLGIALINYGKIERGVTDLTVARLSEIARILEVREIDFFPEYELESGDLIARLEQDVKALNEQLLRSLTKLNDNQDVVESCLHQFEKWMIDKYGVAFSHWTGLELKEYEEETEEFLRVLSDPNARRIYFALLSLGAGMGYFAQHNDLIWRLAPFNKDEKVLLAKYFKWDFDISIDTIETDADPELVRLMVQSKLTESKLMQGR
ncbi:helix-turn-helix domain-containing protein [Dyadobacter sp. OTU695]|uniref:helix-turn-helix domain-containing protein n=1 Tax=Dyadobacter sp. OTU695 TaxID=3043860 RepID=UPI00313AC846